MKKVIHGRMYDTSTAKELATWDNGCPCNDFHWCEEKLYRKRNGEFFLYGQGGPASKYRDAIGVNEWTGGDSIQPLTYKAAQEWAEQLDGAEYEKIFGAVDDDGGKVATTVQLSPVAYEKLKAAAGDKKVSVSELVERFALDL